MNVYAGLVPASPLATLTPEMFASRPEAVQPDAVWVLSVPFALWELWQSPPSDG
jgi:hypothetical protein